MLIKLKSPYGFESEFYIAPDFIGTIERVGNLEAGHTELSTKTGKTYQCEETPGEILALIEKG